MMSTARQHVRGAGTQNGFKVLSTEVNIAGFFETAFHALFGAPGNHEQCHSLRASPWPVDDQSSRGNFSKQVVCPVTPKPASLADPITCMFDWETV